MKTYTVLNYALCYYEVLCNGGIVSHMLNLCTRWSWVVRVTSWPLCPW